MGTPSEGNGDGWPPDSGGPPDGLPGLPPEWGTIVIPDDPAELAAEAAQVRRELRRTARRARRRRLLGLPASAGSPEAPSLGLPLLIMSIAILATLTSLFVVVWPAPHPITEPPQVQRTPAAAPTQHTLPALDLLDATGRAVSLRGSLPAAIILIDGCACAAVVEATLAAAPPAVTVVAVVPDIASLSPAPAGATAPPAGRSGRVRVLADPTGELRKALSLGPATGFAAVILVTRAGDIVETVPAATTVDEYRAALAALAA